MLQCFILLLYVLTSIKSILVFFGAKDGLPATGADNASLCKEQTRRKSPHTTIQGLRFLC